LPLIYLEILILKSNFEMPNIEADDSLDELGTDDMFFQ
jgi:hypothetical protein